MLEVLADYSNWIVGVAASVTAGLLILRKLARWIERVFGKFNAAFETLLGRDEIVHPDTGKVLVEATPGLGYRLAHMEEAIVSLSETNDALTALTQRVDNLSHTVSEHIVKSATNDARRSEEQTAMWKAIKAVAESTPECKEGESV